MIVTVKVGGSILGEGVDESILEDIGLLQKESRLLIVHGGGDEVTRIAERLGKAQRFVVSPEGVRSRYTDLETASIFTMVMAGKVNKEIVAALQRAGMKCVGLSGIDGGILRAQRKKRLIIHDERGRKRVIDGGYTGKIERVNGDLLLQILEMGYIPVVAPVALSEEYEFLNVDGDRAAAGVAGGVKADRVVFLTDVPGVMLDGKVLEHVNRYEAKSILTRVGFGMEKKVMAALEALDMGVKESIIGSGLVEKPISTALAHNGCTVITGE